MAQLAHFPRYLEAVTCAWTSTAPTRPRRRQAGQLRPQEQRYWRLRPGTKAQDACMQELRWLLERAARELFVQELRTPQPVSVKRLG